MNENVKPDLKSDESTSVPDLFSAGAQNITDPPKKRQRRKLASSEDKEFAADTAKWIMLKTLNLVNWSQKDKTKKVGIKNLLSKGAERHITHPRLLCIYLAHILLNETKYTMFVIAAAFNRTDHTVVTHARGYICDILAGKKGDALRDQTQKIIETVKELHKKVSAAPGGIEKALADWQVENEDTEEAYVRPAGSRRTALIQAFQKGTTGRWQIPIPKTT